MSNRPRITRRGDYITPLLEAQSTGYFPPGTVTTVEVRHDDDCPRLDGGLCTCLPDIDLVITPTPSREKKP